MRILLLYPKFPKTFWSFEKALELAGKKALLPPLGIITVAALLPQDWEFKLVDRNIRNVLEEEWEWAELVILSGMIVQKKDFIAQIQESKRRGKSVAVGGPYATALHPELKAAGADFLILDEGEMTLPMFVEALRQGETSGMFRSEVKPDVTETPVPRFDLLDMNAYDNMSVQFSRGCPFQCEFCDIIVLYGRKPRTKTPAQILNELQVLLDLGWNGTIFMVDDNFIGNKRNVKLMLKELKTWREERGYPFSFTTEASVDLADDPELLDLMVECDFHWVFLGIETPSEDSLTLTKKFQNTRNPLIESVTAITEAGIQIMAGFIIGFDGETEGAGDRLVKFVEESAIPIPLFSMLQALPDTALWHRLKAENRLLEGEGNINQTTLMNFIPTRPIDEIATEYIEGFDKLYDPDLYLDRVYRHYMMMGNPRHKETFKVKRSNRWNGIRAGLRLLWRQGVLRRTRVKFWVNLWKIRKHKPDLVETYLTACAFFEHFGEYRQIIREQITEQLAYHLEHYPRSTADIPSVPEEIVRTG